MKRSPIMLRVLTAVLFPPMAFFTAQIAFAEADEAAIASRCILSCGNTARLQQVFAKAERGGPLQIGVIGGSITAGAGASRVDTRYANVIADWWQSSFPKAKVNLVNAGIGATGSNYGALRANRDLLSHRPEFVVVEYAVNDGNTEKCAETFEGLIRQILKQPNHPAVVLLFVMHQNGANAQEWFTKVGRHYDLPMISYRDALWPEIEAGRLKWTDIAADIVHPNDRGHKYAAGFVCKYLDEVRNGGSGKHQHSKVGVPKPLLSDLFEHVSLFEADALEPVTNHGWTLDRKGKCFNASEPGSVVEFEIEGRVLLLMDWHFRGPLAKARVQVDDLPPIVRDGWFEGTWGGYRDTVELARSLKPGKHRVRIELLGDKNPQSTGTEFKIFGLGAAGVKNASR